MIFAKAGRLTTASLPLVPQNLANLQQHSLVPSHCMLNLNQIAGYKKRQTSELLHTPGFTEYDKLPGDQYQTVYVGYYDDKRHNDPRALDRFYRLNWGGWIRARGGRGSKMWQKTVTKMWWSKQHVLCSEWQSEQLEKMFEQKYRKKKFFVDHPYEMYEERNDHEYLPIGHRSYSYSYVKAKDFDGY